jgi:hypothetical protein
MDDAIAHSAPGASALRERVAVLLIVDNVVDREGVNAAERRL